MQQPRSDEFRAKVISSARELASTWPVQSPVFSVLTGWSRSYDNIFAGEFDWVTSEDGILDRALSAGRAILSGRGGDGKTWLLRRLFSRALDRGIVPVFIDLKQWTGADYESWKDWTRDNVGDGADFLVRRFSGLNLGIIDLDRLPPDARKVMFVDGLNEITAKVGLEVLSVFDEIVASQMSTSVIAVDRLVRRDLPSPERWWIGSPLPLTGDEVRKHLPKGAVLTSSDLRTSPFFLDAELRSGASGVRRAATLKQLVNDHIGLTNAEAIKVAEACFLAYAYARSRMFDLVKFREGVGQVVLDKLEQAGAVRFLGTNGFFHHHIMHDFLAAAHVASFAPTMWTPDIFRALSFDTSSFDAVELTFEQLEADLADSFLQKLYDWNLYAAGYALAQRRQGDGPVGLEMQTVIFAMLADKCFDPVLATRQRASDALRLMQVAEVEPFRRAKSISELCAVVDATDSSTDWFNEWKRVFRISELQVINEVTLVLITQANSILGWTVANVSKRVIDSQWVYPLLSHWAEESDNATVRWRIAHVLGAIPHTEALQCLQTLFDYDQDEDVRYGSIRSLIELATISDRALRDEVGVCIAARAGVISSSDRIARELRSSLLIEPSLAPVGWLDFVQACVKSQFLATERVADRDLWRGCLNTAERLYDRVQFNEGHTHG